jgi:hypothetical protein
VKVKIATLLSLVALLLSAVGARADTTYTYTGTPMTEGTTPDVCGGGPCTITGSFTVATPLGDNVPFSYTNTITPESFSFTDGNQTIATGSSVLYFNVGTDASGDIDAWVIQVYGLYDGTSFILTDNVGLDESYRNGSTAYNSSQGTWDPETTPTPEPSGLPLLSSGLFAVACLALRKRQLEGRCL